ncbi:MAG TPA: hypothetical protein VG826_23410 [Pirellulales bacterium]|nr:hypothetical protein [Pirellulales bacterium]
MRYPIFLATACLVAVCCEGKAQTDDSRVGPLGNAGRLAVRGVHSAPPREVAKALFADADVAYSSFPDAPLRELKRLLIEKAVLGFQHSGFPSPRVTIADRLDHLELSVEEGPRWTAGAIRVDGAKLLDAGRLAAGLQPDVGPRAKASAQSASCWATGQPAHLDESSRQLLSKRVEELLAQQGFIDAQSAVQIAGDRGRGVATLVVTIQHEGEPARVSDIELTGNKLHTRDQLFAWLQMPADAVVSTDVGEAIERRLNASGRFRSCAFYPAGPGTKPRLWVDESTFAPRLDQPLSREEEALLRLAAWIDHFDRQGDDLVLEGAGAGKWLDLVISPRDGFVVRAGSRERPRESGGFDVAIASSGNQIIVFSTNRRQMLALVADGLRPAAIVDLVGSDGKLALKLGVAGQTTKPKRRSTTVGPKLTAADALSIVRKYHARCSWEGPVLTAEWKGRRLRFDSRDGRLVDFRDAEGKLRLLTRKANQGMDSWFLETAAGEFTRRSKAIASAGASFTNVADDRRFFSGALEFVSRELLDLDVLRDNNSERLATGLIGLSQRHAFQPLDDFIFNETHNNSQPFQIPPAALPDAQGVKWHTDHKGLHIKVRFLRPNYADDLFAHDSRWWHVWREAAFITVGKTEHLQERLARLFPEAQSGPLTDLALAEAMLLAGLKEEAATLARQGLERISLEAFRRDYRDLLVPGGRIGSFLLTTAEAVRGLSEAETETLTRFLADLHWISRTRARQAVAFATELRADVNRPPAAALGAALDALWHATLEQEVISRLDAISSAAAQSNDAQQVRRRGLLFR